MHILLGFADWKLQWQLSSETLLPLPGAIKTKPVWAGFSLLSKKKKKCLLRSSPRRCQPDMESPVTKWWKKIGNRSAPEQYNALAQKRIRTSSLSRLAASLFFGKLFFV